MTAWDSILDHIRASVPADDFRRYFGDTTYASDSGDQITVWVPSEAIRRHVRQHYDDAIRRALRATGRADTDVRFVVGGTDEDDEDATER
jgi:chromosomal replication initiation ATPase DnaA